ncbi:hypothetical protein K1719_007997 [Acacia pycnantha]|nr:hypothetical protein K1719_007997 [Acacia pycnantha]
MTRLHEISTLLQASRLLQQFIVDGYTMIESQRLLWVRTHQKELRVDLFQGLTDAVLSGETNCATIGKRIILPSSFTGGARYMMQNYQDAMAICRSEDIYTIEFQKRGLPHAHILLFLYPNDKIKDPEAIDNFICAEMPDKNISPLMYKLVRQFMLHGPCDRSNIKAPCMKNQKCSKYFPKKFNENTINDEDGNPSVERSSFHLPNQQYVIYSNHDYVAELLDKPRVSESQFLAWMEKNKTDAFARTLTYIEFPKHYVYQRNNKAWKRRKKGSSVGRITHVSPSSGEFYYLRVLLTKVRGLQSFDEIKTVDGFIHNTLKDACFARGLLDDDQEYISAIKEASIWASDHSLRKLFVSMLLCFSLHRLDFVWKETSKLLSEDLLCIHHNDPMSSKQVALQEINSLLRKNGKSLLDFPTMPLPEELPPIDVSNQLILQELNYDKYALQVEANNLQNSLNLEKKQIFNNVMSCEGGFFFVYGCGGTGKTFLWNALTSSLRAKDKLCSQLHQVELLQHYYHLVEQHIPGDSHDNVEEIEIPGDLLISGYQDPIRAIVESTYINLFENLNSNEYFNDRAILAPTIEMINSINEHMCAMFPGEPYEFLSCDSVSQLGKTVIEAITLNGLHPNQKVLIHRMDMNPSESIWPFRMKRRQFLSPFPLL